MCQPPRGNPLPGTRVQPIRRAGYTSKSLDQAENGSTARRTKSGCPGVSRGILPQIPRKDQRRHDRESTFDESGNVSLDLPETCLAIMNALYGAALSVAGDGRVCTVRAWTTVEPQQEYKETTIDCELPNARGWPTLDPRKPPGWPMLSGFESVGLAGGRPLIREASLVAHPFGRVAKTSRVITSVPHPPFFEGGVFPFPPSSSVLCLLR